MELIVKSTREIINAEYVTEDYKFSVDVIKEDSVFKNVSATINDLEGRYIGNGNYADGNYSFSVNENIVKLTLGFQAIVELAQAL